MKVRLKPQQSQTISEFSNDLAKALMLAALLGQGIVEKNILLGVLNTIVLIAFSLFFLYSAVNLRKKI